MQFMFFTTRCHWLTMKCFVYMVEARDTSTAIQSNKLLLYFWGQSSLWKKRTNVTFPRGKYTLWQQEISNYGSLGPLALQFCEMWTSGRKTSPHAIEIYSMWVVSYFTSLVCWATKKAGEHCSIGQILSFIKADEKQTHSSRLVVERGVVLTVNVNRVLREIRKAVYSTALRGFERERLLGKPAWVTY